MPNAYAGFFKGQDQLGSSVSLNYRGNASFGTVLGGICSLLATLFFSAFILVQMYAWLFQPSYNQSVEKTYLNRNANSTYSVPIQSFLPTFTIGSTVGGAFNPSEYFSWSYYQVNYFDSTPIEAVLCNDLIESWQLSEDELNDMRTELIYDDYMLCPNVTSVDVKGGILSAINLELQITATDEAVQQGLVGQYYVYTGEITRYFNVDDY